MKEKQPSKPCPCCGEDMTLVENDGKCHHCKCQLRGPGNNALKPMVWFDDGNGFVDDIHLLGFAICYDCMWRVYGLIFNNSEGRWVKASIN